jgi:hypothetical protein
MFVVGAGSNFWASNCGNDFRKTNSGHAKFPPGATPVEHLQPVNLTQWRMGPSLLVHPKAQCGIVKLGSYEEIKRIAMLGANGNGSRNPLEGAPILGSTLWLALQRKS